MLLKCPCSIVKEGSDLNIEIHKKCPRWQKLIHLKCTSEDNVACTATIKFNDICKHLALESQKEPKCRLILVSIASNMLKIP